MDQIADYKLLRSLGEGNHGQFFVAVPPARLHVDAEHVAVKVMGAPSQEDALRRATREMRAFASANSPFLIKLLDAGQDGKFFFYATEYAELGSLAAPGRDLSKQDVYAAMGRAARAAHALHEVGVVHRGIKPGNVLLAKDGAKLSDLGLALSDAPGQTVTGMGPIQSVEYTDPALLQGEPASRANDIWSLGVTMHRALTGTGVYGDLPNSDPLFAVRRVLTTSPVLSDDLTPGERDVISSCLQPDPAERPATAEQLAKTIEALA